MKTPAFCYAQKDFSKIFSLFCKALHPTDAQRFLAEIFVLRTERCSYAEVRKRRFMQKYQSVRTATLSLPLISLII